MHFVRAPDKNLYVFLVNPPSKAFLHKAGIKAKLQTLSTGNVDDLDVILRAISASEFVTRNPDDRQIMSTLMAGKAAKWATELWQSSTTLRSTPAVTFTMKPNGELSPNFGSWYRKLSHETQAIQSIRDIRDPHLQVVLSHIDSHETQSTTENIEISGVPFVLQVRALAELIEVTMAPLHPTTSKERKRFEKIAGAA